MLKTKDIVCIVCPNGCRLMVSINEENKVTLVENALCNRGETYAKDEIQSPRRSLTSTVKVVGGNLELVSVRSDRPIPKAILKAAVAELRKLELEAPIKYHQVLIKDLLGTGANIISTKEVLKNIK